jgi:lipopolysaccharide transport system ATP-binding protein
MAPVSIRASDLGKSYRITHEVDRYRTLRDAMAQSIARAIRSPSSLLRASEGETFWALRDVSFEVPRGEIFGVIGSNGAGKSTLLKLLSRITPPTTGRVEIVGRVGSLLEVGTGFHPELTGRENIILNGAILGMRRVEIARKFDEIVAFAEVERFIDTPVKRYSSGMYLRLAFAVAAHLEPEILLVDEVLAVGDAAFQKKCLGKMDDLVREGRTVLFVSHNMAAVQSLCDRVIWLRDGRIVEEGASATVVSRYLQSTQQSLTEQRWDDPRTAPGNEKVLLFSARVVRDDGRTGSAAPIDVRTPFRLEFEYWNLQAGAILNLSLLIYNEQGVLVFNAVPLTEKEWQGRPFPIGLFRDVCHVPGDLLNNGNHRVELLIVQDEGTVIFRMDDVLVFDVHDSVELRGSWYGRWVGVVRPVLPWTITIVREGAPPTSR